MQPAAGTQDYIIIWLQMLLHGTDSNNNWQSTNGAHITSLSLLSSLGCRRIGILDECDVVPLQHDPTQRPTVLRLHVVLLGVI